MKKRPFIEREALYWLTFFAPAITLLISRWGGDAPLSRVVGCLLSTWISTAICGLAVHSVVNFVAPRILARTSQVVGAALIAAIATVTAVAVLVVLLPRLVVVDANLSQPIAPFVFQGIAVCLLYVAGGRLVTWLRQREADALEQKLRARLAALQAQVNPHFLFNTLNAIASLIPKDPARAEETVERLASVLQYSITSTSKGRVTLGEELAAVRDYLEIEQARFGERLRSKIDVDDAIEADAIPPMLLQPLVENAVLHGLSSRDEGGAVTVQGRIEEDAMILKVSDDGVGPGGSKRRGNKTGLANLRERLALTYGAAAQLSVGPRPGGGFECEIRVPRTTS